MKNKKTKKTIKYDTKEKNCNNEFQLVREKQKRKKK